MTQTYAGQSTQQKTFYNRTLLERLIPNLVFLQHGQKKPIPKHEGAVQDFRRFSRLEPATTALTEGITPAGKDLSIINITATVEGYGDYVTISDFIDMAGIDPVVTETIEVLGEQAAETLDVIVRDVIAAGTNVYYPGGGAARENVETAHTYTGTAGRRVRQIMARNNVKPLGGKKYLAFIHPDASHDLMADNAWIYAKNYADPKAVIDGEIGELNGIRYIETTMAPIWEDEGNASEDVYGTIVIGKNAYGVPDIAGSSKPETFVKALGSAGASDPLNQRSSVGWKAYLAAIRLDELCILRVEHSASVGAL